MFGRGRKHPAADDRAADEERRGATFAHALVLAQSDPDPQRSTARLTKLYTDATDDDIWPALCGFMWTAHTIPSVMVLLSSVVVRADPSTAPAFESALRVAETGDILQYDGHSELAQIALLASLARICATDPAGREAIEAGFERGTLIAR